MPPQIKQRENSNQIEHFYLAGGREGSIDVEQDQFIDGSVSEGLRGHSGGNDGGKSEKTRNQWPRLRSGTGRESRADHVPGIHQPQTRSCVTRRIDALLISPTIRHSAS